MAGSIQGHRLTCPGLHCSISQASLQLADIAALHDCIECELLFGHSVLLGRPNVTAKQHDQVHGASSQQRTLKVLSPDRDKAQLGFGVCDYETCREDLHEVCLTSSPGRSRSCQFCGHQFTAQEEGASVSEVRSKAVRTSQSAGSPCSRRMEWMPQRHSLGPAGDSLHDHLPALGCNCPDCWHLRHRLRHEAAKDFRLAAEPWSGEIGCQTICI